MAGRKESLSAENLRKSPTSNESTSSTIDGGRCGDGSIRQSSTSAPTDLTVSDLLEQALRHSPGAYRSSQYPSGRDLQSFSSSRSVPKKHRGPTKRTVLPKSSRGENKIDIDALMKQIDHIPTPSVGGSASMRSRRFELMPTGSSATQRFTGRDDYIADCEKALYEKDMEIMMLKEKLSLEEQKNTQNILELTLALQDKIATIKSYEKLLEQAKKSGKKSDKAFDAGIADMFSKYNFGSSPMSNISETVQNLLDLVKRLETEREQIVIRREQSELKHRELEQKYSNLAAELNRVRAASNYELRDAASSMNYKNSEVESLKVQLAETKEKLKESEEESSELRVRIEFVRESMHVLQSHRERDINNLRLELQMKSAKLQMYENIELSLDGVIDSAAAIASGLPPMCDEKVPTDSKRRLQQSLDLTTKVNQLEKVIEEQKQEILDLYDQREILRSEINAFKSSTSVPVSNLVQTISQKNLQLEKLNHQLLVLEKEYCAIEADKNSLEKSLEQQKAHQEQVFELFKATSNLAQSTTNIGECFEKDAWEQITQQSPVVSKPPSNEGLKHLQKKIQVENIDSDEEDEEEQACKINATTSHPGNFLSLQKPLALPKQSTTEVTMQENLRPVALHRSKVTPPSTKH